MDLDTSDIVLACDVTSSSEVEQSIPSTPGRKEKVSGDSDSCTPESIDEELSNKKRKWTGSTEEINTEVDFVGQSADLWFPQDLNIGSTMEVPMNETTSTMDVNMEETGSQAVETEAPYENPSTSEADKVMNSDYTRQLKEFDVLDETDEDEDDNMDSEDLEDSEDYPSNDEVDAMLEEGMQKGNSQNGRKEFTEKTKVLLVEKTSNPFEVLPSGWVMVAHDSGMPLYLHRATRVCSLTKPYFLGSGSARKHDIPLSAVPCLEYKRAQEEEAKEAAEKNDKNVLVVNGKEIPNAKVESVQENQINNQLTPQQLKEYCDNRFEFKTINVIRFNSWTARRQFQKRNRPDVQRPTLPVDTKLITCPVLKSESKRGRTREWTMNPVGKSHVCILHEYVQRVLNNQPVYKFKELEHTANPYMATVHIGDMQYGTGMGKSKKLAKHAAARATLEILIPGFKDKFGEVGNVGLGRSSKTDLSFFDDIKIEDPRVTELCMKTTEPLPHTVLLTCLQRNFGMGETHIKYETKTLKHAKNEFTMTVGSHKASVVCQNKRDGKQKASQAILQALHPHVPSWGSLLRLYGNSSVKSVKEKKMEEQKITYLQSKGTTNGPNYAILQKLEEEMRKYRVMKTSVKRIGKFVPPDDVNLPQASSADLDNVNL